MWSSKVRYLQAGAFLALLLVVGIFAVQNTGVITVNFLTWNVAQSIAILSVAVYFLGMLSGWTILGFMKGSFRQVAHRPGR
jgi:lipopolysaccharide assembly protein A